MLTPNPSIKLNIIYEDKNIIVIDKPAGILVHPINQDQTDTIANGLIAHSPAVQKAGENPLRPGIVHRLDRDTSGLLVIAKNNNAFRCLKKQFQERTVEKRYLALVVGQVKDDSGIIAKALTFSLKGRQKRSALLDTHSKQAVTKYKVQKKFKNYTLLEVRIETGRTHQIRAHMASIGHPIAGDKEYKFKRQICPENLQRQFLHAYHLKFRLPDGNILEFKSELPKDLGEVVKTLK